MFVYMFNSCSRVAQSFCVVETNFATFYASGIKGEVRGASETLCIVNLKKIRQAKKSKIYYESAEESWAVAYKELSYSQSSSSSSVMSSFFQDGMQEPFQESVSLSLTSV